MEWVSIGKNIREQRMLKHMRQEDLAEKIDVSVNYIGMIERGVKVPSLKTFVLIANALGVSADILLIGVIDKSFEVKNTLLSEKIGQCSIAEQTQVYNIIEAFLK